MMPKANQPHTRKPVLMVMLCVMLCAVTVRAQQLANYRGSQRDGLLSEALGGSANCALSQNEIIAISHKVAAPCDLLEVYGNTKIVVKTGGTLTVDGALDLFGGAEITVEPGATLHVGDDLHISGNSKLNLNGTLQAHGNIIVSGMATACGKGHAEVSGVVSGSAWCYDIRITTAQPLKLAASMDDNQRVELSWSEEAGAVEKVRVERSENGMTFIEIGTVSRQSSFVDTPPSGKTYYYRLSRISRGETVVVSEIIAVSLFDDKTEGLCTLEVTPTPCVPFCEARIVNCPNGNFKTHILDASGNIITELIPYFEADRLIKYHINKDNFLMPGIYIINSQNDKARLSKKVIVK